VLFLVNLAGYNQVLFEDISKNRMHESLELFESVAQNELFADTPIFLFLNKKDIFETQILEVDMKGTFPEYEGGTNLANALDFTTKLFQVGVITLASRFLRLFQSLVAYAIKFS
jgi:hypothetical protein